MSDELFNAIEAKAAGVIADTLAVELTEVQREANFADDLGADSLDMVELTMEFEEAFGIEISDAEAQECKTVGDAFKAIERALAHEADASIRPVVKNGVASRHLLGGGQGTVDMPSSDD